MQRHRFYLENFEFKKDRNKVFIFDTRIINKNAHEIYLLFGPEGGWSREESDSAEKYGWKTASLGAKILRAETAAIVASFIALQQYL
jgi:RsmE family RNA methyltransferase